MPKREDLIVSIARAAHDAHYCVAGYSGELCENCVAEGRSDCFELSGGFDLDEQHEWRQSATAALETIERHLGIEIK